MVALREIADGLVTNEILIEKPSVELGEVEEEMAAAVANSRTTRLPPKSSPLPPQESRHTSPSF